MLTSLPRPSNVNRYEQAVASGETPILFFARQDRAHLPATALHRESTLTANETLISVTQIWDNP